MFDKTKTKINQQVNDRVTSPIRTSIIISVTAFVMAGLALIMAVKHANH